MKQTLLMCVLVLLGTAGSFVKGPFYGVAVYYLFAVLRPQYQWEWALPPGVEWSLYVAIATIASTLLRRRTCPRSDWLTPGSTAMLLFGVWVTLSYLFANDRNVAFQPYIEYLKIFVMFFCGMLVIKEFTQVKVLYLIAVISLGYIAYEFNYNYIFERRMDIFKLGYGGLDNNGAGLMIAMGVPMAFFVWQGYTRWWRWFFLAIIPPMLHAVLMSYSRGAMVSLLICIPLFIVRSSKKKLMIVGMVFLLALLPVLAGKEIRSRFFSVEEYQIDDSANLRFDSWKAALGIAMDFPVFGAGVRNANLLSYKYGADIEGRTIHSVYLQIAADSGFPAMVFYIAAFFAVLRVLTRFRGRHRSSTSKEGLLAYNLACGVESALAVFCIGAAFLSLETFELPYLLVLIGLQLPYTFLGKETSPGSLKVPGAEYVAQA